MKKAALFIRATLLNPITVYFLGVFIYIQSLLGMLFKTPASIEITVTLSSMVSAYGIVMLSVLIYPNFENDAKTNGKPVPLVLVILSNSVLWGFVAVICRQSTVYSMLQGIYMFISQIVMWVFIETVINKEKEKIRELIRNSMFLKLKVSDFDDFIDIYNRATKNSYSVNVRLRDGYTGSFNDDILFREEGSALDFDDINGEIFIGPFLKTDANRVMEIFKDKNIIELVKKI